MNLPKNFRFSQSSLQDYMICPKRFYLRNIQKINWPAEETSYNHEFEIRQQLGTRFHLLILRHLSGMNKEDIANNLSDPLLQHWWSNFVNFFEDRFEHGQTFPEFALTGPIDNSPTIAKFDLIHIEGDSITIYDWKTSKRIPKLTTVERKIQTRLYLYLLSRYGNVISNELEITPEKLNMIYWFAEQPSEQFKFTYSSEMQKSDEIFITDLIQAIKLTTEGDFKETDDKRMCTYCAYRSFCEKPNQIGDIEEFERNFNLDPEDLNFDFSFDDLDEVVYG